MQNRSNSAKEAREGCLPGYDYLSYGFRPFFLGAAVWAIVSIACGRPILRVVRDGDGIRSDLLHAHEMLFGFAPAILAGFLLTAVPNWTGRLPIAGGR